MSAKAPSVSKRDPARSVFQEVEGPFWLHVHDCWEIFPKDAKVKFSLLRKSGKNVSASTPSSVSTNRRWRRRRNVFARFLNKLNFTFASFGKIGFWLDFGGGSAFAWILGCFPLLLSLEIMTSRSSELCLSEIVGSSVGSAPEPGDHNRDPVIELLFHSDHGVSGWTGWVGKWSCFEKKRKKERKEKKDAGAVWEVFLGKVQAEWCQGHDSRSDIVLQKACIDQDVFAGACLCGWTTHGVTVWCQDVTRLRMAFLIPKENDGHGHDCIFYFGFQIPLLYGGYPQHLPVWILGEGETPVPGRSCTSTIITHDSGILLEKSLIWNHSSQKKKKKEPLALQWRGFTLCSLRIRLRIGDSESLHVFSEFHTARFFRLQIWLRMARFWQSKSRGGSTRILIRSATYQPASIRILRRSATYQPASIRILIRSATYQPASIRILRRSATYQPASIRILRRSATYQLASIRILRRSATYQPASIRSLGVQLYRLIRAIFFSTYSELYFVHNLPSTESL